MFNILTIFQKYVKIRKKKSQKRNINVLSTFYKTILT